MTRYFDIVCKKVPDKTCKVRDNLKRLKDKLLNYLEINRAGKTLSELHKITKSAVRQSRQSGTMGIVEAELSRSVQFVSGFLCNVSTWWTSPPLKDWGFCLRLPAYLALKIGGDFSKSRKGLLPSSQWSSPRRTLELRKSQNLFFLLSNYRGLLGSLIFVKTEKRHYSRG